MSTLENNQENKSKQVIPEHEYNCKLASCAGSALFAAGSTLFTTFFFLPFFLKRIKFLPSTTELRFAAGSVIGVSGAYYSAKYRKQKCLEGVKDNYQY